MRRKQAGPETPIDAATTAVVMILYVANSGPNSVQAVTNLEAICAEYLGDNYRLEIVDVFEFPQRALADGVVVTPSLTKLSPSPAARIVGNLSDRSSVVRALGLVARTP